MNTLLCLLCGATMTAAGLFAAASNALAGAAPPPGPLAFGPDLIEVTADNGFGHRYRAWGDYEGELASYRQEAEALAAQRSHPPLQSHALALFLKNVAVTSDVALDAGGNKTALSVTPDSAIAAWDKEKQRYADFMFAYTRGEIQMVWHSEIITNRIDYSMTGTNFGFSPYAARAQLTAILDAKYRGQQVDLTFAVPGQARTPNGTVVAGDGAAGMAWMGVRSFYGGACIRIESQYVGLAVMVHESLHITLDDNAKRSEGLVSESHNALFLGYQSSELGWPQGFGWSFLTCYRDKSFYYYPSDMWSRFTMNGTNNLSFPAFGGTAYAWEQVKYDFLKKLPIIHDAELAQLTGIPSASIISPNQQSYSQFTVSPADESRVLSPYVGVSSESDTRLNNLLSTTNESCAVIQTATGTWFFVKPDLVDVFVNLFQYRGSSAGQLEVYGYSNLGNRPLVCIKAPTDTPLPADERSLFWPPAGDTAPVFTQRSFEMPQLITAGIFLQGSLLPYVSDPDPGEVLSFYKVTGPAWLSVSTNGDWAGTPTGSDVGFNAFKIRAVDRFGLSDETTLVFGRTNLVVTTPGDAGPGSLRDAITAANAQFGKDTITFNIVGTGVQTIAPLTALPSITDPVVIDGYSQPEAAPGQLGLANLPHLLIQITGTNLASAANGLALTTSNSLIRGLVINRFGSRGISLKSGASRNRIEGCFIGTDPSGTLSQTNGSGIEINWGAGNIVGGSGFGSGNLISGNYDIGLVLRSASSTNNLVQGNYLGLDITGTNALGNGGDGLRIECPYSRFAGNVVSGNRANGVRAWGSAAHDNRIEGNLVGSDASGRLAVSNTSDGIVLYLAPSNTVGGTSAGAGNLLSGNGGCGLHFDGAGASNNVALGNFIGVDITGTKALSNRLDGVFIYASDCVLGGSVPGARNVLSGNGRSGCALQDARAKVLGNFVGVDVSGTKALPNITGVYVGGAASDNQIGGIGVGEGNLIAYNRGKGVTIGYLATATLTNNSVRGNSIYGNAGLGIDLANNGMTANHVGGSVTGPNLWQNYPVLSAAVLEGGTAILGSLNSQSNTTYQVDFYASDAVDASGYGEGQTYLGTADVTTDTSGNQSFGVTLEAKATVGSWITATATDPFGNTSEFSRAIQLRAPPQFLPVGLSLSNGVFSAQVAGLPTNAHVVIESSTNLQTWIPISTNTVAGDTLSFRDFGSANLPHRFYRAKLIPQ
jgi:hypothetical protein